jgi:activator of HSP90 ATPase
VEPAHGGGQDSHVVPFCRPGKSCRAKRRPTASDESQIKLDVGSSYSLFGGNVTGEIKEVQKPTLLVQTWQTKSPGWPRDHYGTMTMSLKQGESSTKSGSLSLIPSSHKKLHH